MRHGLMYHGGFERNFPLLRPGATKFVGTDGSEHTLPDVPPEITGVRVWYMEKAGKKFAAAVPEVASRTTGWRAALARPRPK